MPMESDLDNVQASDSGPSRPPDPTETRPPTATPPELAYAAFEITIERDLAVQIVGSDAGRARRMRPHGAMTKGGSAQELVDVQAIMEPFLHDEIRRVYEDRTHRPVAFVARATPQQAGALKAYCLRFAAVLEQHLSRHPGDDSRHRSQQRLDQARRVIAQVNAALGLPAQDGRTPEQLRSEVIAKAKTLDAALEALRSHPEHRTNPPAAAQEGLQEALRGYLRHCAGL